MIAEPYLCVDGTEVSNPARVAAYLAAADLPAVDLWFDGGCCAAWADDDGYSPTPAGDDTHDPAPWYVAGRPESAEFLGFWADPIEVDAVASRETTANSGRRVGSTLGPLRLRHRTLAVTGTLWATTVRGLAYGEAWLADVLTDAGCATTAELVVWSACPDPTDPDPGRWERTLVSAGLVDGPVPSAGPIRGVTRRVSFQAVSEMPWLYGPGSQVVAETTTVTLYGLDGTFGNLEGDTTLPRGQSFTTSVVDGDEFPPGTQRFFSHVCPDGVTVASTVIPWSGSQFDPEPQNTMSVAFYNKATGERYQVYVSTSEGRGLPGDPPGFYGGDTSDLCNVVTSDGPRVVAWCMRDYDGAANLNTSGRWPAMASFKLGTDGRYELDLDRTFTVDELFANAVSSLTLALDVADACYPETTNGHGQAYRLNGGYGEACVLPNGWMSVVHYLQDNDLGGTGRSGRLMLVDPEGITRAFLQLPDMTDWQGHPLGLLPRDHEACPVALSDGRMVTSVVYDSFSAGDPYPALLQLVVADPAASPAGYEPLSAAVLPPGDFVTGAETLTDNLDVQFAIAGWNADGSLWGHTAHANAETGNPFATLNSRACNVWKMDSDTWGLVTQAPATGSWETDAGRPVVADFPLAGLSDQMGGTLAARGHHQSPAGTVAVIGNGGYVLPVVPDAPLERKQALPSNETFAASVTGWAPVSGTTNTPTWEATDGGRMRVVKNALGTTGIVGTGANPTAIPAEFRDGHHSAYVNAWVKFSAACDFKVSLTLRNAAGSTIFTYESPWRPGSTTDYVPAQMHAMIATTAVSISRGITFRNAATGTVMYVAFSEQDVAPVYYPDFLNLGLSSLQAAGPAGSRFGAVKGGFDADSHLWASINHAAGTAVLADDDTLPQYLYEADLSGLAVPWVGTYTTDPWGRDATFVVDVYAGEPGPVTDLRVRFTPKRADTDPCPPPWPPCVEWLIPRLESGDRLVVDGRARRVLAYPGTSKAPQPGEGLIVPVWPEVFDWPDVPPCTTMCVEVEAGGMVNDDTFPTVTAYPRELG